jgi:hypothetical protein
METQLIGTHAPTRHVTVPLTLDLAKRLEALAFQSGKTLESFLVQLAEKAAIESIAVTPVGEMPIWQRSIEEQRAAWNQWCDGHAPTTHFVDDSRESIYD